MAQETMTGRSNFARTCNRLSQFLRERRSFGDIGFNSIASPKLEMKEERKLIDSTNMEEVEKKSLDLFPLTTSSSTLCFEESTNNMALSRNFARSKEEAQKTGASMTIIYEGKVVVLEGLEEEMAEEIMRFATQNVVTTPQQQTFLYNNTITTHLTQRLSDFPIARGASLHRFMEKRKHRIAASAPYQLNNSSTRRQLREQQEEHQLELKLW